MFLSFIRFIITFIPNMIFSLKREKLIDEDKKYEFLDSQFKDLVNSEKGLFDGYSSDYNVTKVYSVDVSMPKNNKEQWKVFKTLKSGDDYNQVEIFSLIDGDLEFKIFKNKALKIIKDTNLNNKNKIITDKKKQPSSNENNSGLTEQDDKIPNYSHQEKLFDFCQNNLPAKFNVKKPFWSNDYIWIYNSKIQLKLTFNENLSLEESVFVERQFSGWRMFVYIILLIYTFFIGGIIFYFLQRATKDDVTNFKNEVLVVLKKFKK